MHCQVQGPVGPLLKVLAAAGVSELLSREPSLEELFLALYGAGGSADEGVGPASDRLLVAARPAARRPASGRRPRRGVVAPD